MKTVCVAKVLVGPLGPGRPAWELLVRMVVSGSSPRKVRNGLRGEGIGGAFGTREAGVGIVGEDGGERVVAAEGEKRFGAGDDDSFLVDSGLDVDHGVGRGGIDGGLHGLVLALGADRQFAVRGGERTSE